MNRGPQRGTTRTDYRETAVQSWSPAPDWVLALATVAVATTGSAAAALIGYSPAVVSDVLRNKYRGDLTRVEASVRAALMRGVIPCPILGEISAAECLGHQKAPYRGANPVSVRLHGECPRCPHSSGRAAP